MNLTQEGDRLYLYSITTVAILGGLLFGYDTAVISGAEKGLEAFFLTATDFQYDKVMHGITSSSALIGCVIGGAISGYLASRLGRRDSLRLASVMFFLSALGSYYPEFLFFEYGKANWDLLIAFNLYRVLGGVGVGLASAVCPMYIAEIAPSHIRGTLVSCNQFAIIFGMLVVYFVNYMIMGDHQNPVILKTGKKTWIPRLRIRSLRWDSANRNAAEKVWRTRMRFGGHDQPLYGHAFMTWWNRYGKKHPEYFALNSLGTRAPAPRAGDNRDNPAAYQGKTACAIKMCVSSPELIKQVIANWDKKKRYINLCENDSPPMEYCRCPECRKLDTAKDGAAVFYELIAE